MKPSAKEFKNRSFRRCLFSYLLILVLPIALFSGLFWRFAGGLSGESMRLFRLGFIVCSVLSLLIGGLISCRFAMHSCRPMRSPEGLFGSEVSNPTDGGDELATLVLQIRELQELNLQAEEKLAGQQELLRQAVADACRRESPTLEQSEDRPSDPCSCEEETPAAENRVDMIIGRVKIYIDENYADMNLSVTMIAEDNGVSPSYLAQIFKKRTGHSTADYIHTTRLKNAKLLLNSCRVKDIAEMVGYQDVRSLIRVFKKYEGATPTQFRGEELSRQNRS